jgi:hypothetical protein
MYTLCAKELIYCMTTVPGEVYRPALGDITNDRIRHSDSTQGKGEHVIFSQILLQHAYYCNCIICFQSSVQIV